MARISPYLKNFFFFVLILFVLSCESSFSFDTDERAEVTDPVIDPFSDNNQPDPETFGCSNAFCYGYEIPPGDIAQIDINIPFPESHDLSSFLPPVGSQGEQGSCVGWATGYYLKSFQENLEAFNNDQTDSNRQMSPAFVYNQIKVGTCADGSKIPDALALIFNSGIVSWQEMPYDYEQCDTQPTEMQQDLAQVNKISSFAALNGDLLFEQTKAFLLNNQPIVIAISVDRSYFGEIDSDGDAVYRGFENNDGAHAMLLVGYDDQKNAFKAVNSWGRNWGNDGFVWIDYKAFQEVMDVNSDFKVICEAWVTTDIIL